MAFEARYNTDRDEKEGGRRRESQYDTNREIGMRLGSFEIGMRSVTKEKKLDEQRREFKGKVRRVFSMGFAPALAGAAP